MMGNLRFGVIFAVTGIFVIACTGSTTTTGTSPTGDGGASSSSSSSGGSTLCAGQNPPSGTGTLLLCGQCAQSKCCTEIQACAADANCTTLQTCLLRCTATDQGCIDACDNLYPDSITVLNNATNCSSQECTYSCTQPPAGCTNLPLDTTGNCDQTQFPLAWDCPGGQPEQTCVDAPSGKANEYCCLQ